MGDPHDLYQLDEVVMIMISYLPTREYMYWALASKYNYQRHQEWRPPLHICNDILRLIRGHMLDGTHMLARLTLCRRVQYHVTEIHHLGNLGFMATWPKVTTINIEILKDNKRDEQDQYLAKYFPSATKVVIDRNYVCKEPLYIPLQINTVVHVGVVRPMIIKMALRCRHILWLSIDFRGGFVIAEPKIL